MTHRQFCWLLLLMILTLLIILTFSTTVTTVHTLPVATSDVSTFNMTYMNSVTTAAATVTYTVVIFSNLCVCVAVC